MIKKIFTIAIALSALGLVLSGCSQGGGEAATTGGETAGTAGTTGGETAGTAGTTGGETAGAESGK